MNRSGPSRGPNRRRRTPIVQPADETAPVGFSAPTRPAAAPRLARYLVLATSLALVAVAIWFGVRRTRPPAAQAPSSAAAPASSATRAPSARPDPAPAGANASVPEAAATAGTPTPPEAALLLLRPRLAATATGVRFDIVVASFRTDARAASVAAEVAALGLPVRRRVSDGWQQVVSGPFASRS